MTRLWGVPRREHGGFFRLAQEYLHMARIAADKKAYSVAVSNCTDSAIRAVDAMTVLRAEKRSARHPIDDPELSRSVLAGRGRRGLERQYRLLLAMKVPAEYESTMMTARQASNALRWAERIVGAARAEIEARGFAPAPGRPARRSGA